MIGNERLLTNGWQILKFSECIKQLNTGLNPRNHFSLGHGSLKYITAKNLTQFGTIDFSKCDFVALAALNYHLQERTITDKDTGL